MAILGCIADDFTGATDLAGTLVQEGMRSVQMIGVPGADAGRPDADAIVIALKSRTAPVESAVEESLAALRWLQGAGCRQFFFKYCSTFDSTPRGNIGPVAEALLDALEADFTLACPAFPKNKRTVFKGYLFVGDVLLNESGMQDHPLTPMTDANLVRVLTAQSRSLVGLVGYDTVQAGAAEIERAFTKLRSEGRRLAIVDALSDGDLRRIGEASAELKLITGGSGIAIGLPENYRKAGLLQSTGAASDLPPTTGPAAILSGSCSRMTQEQVQNARAAMPAFQIDALALGRGEDLARKALDWAGDKLGADPILVYATAAPEQVRAAQNELGVEKAGVLIEDCLASIAKGLVERGVRRLIVAGGETSGAVVKALGVRALRIGPEIAPGVPWTLSLGEPAIALALKSGNFGAPDFFITAFDKLP